MTKHLKHFRIIFKLFVKLNISIKSIKIFLVCSNVILLNQKIKALDFSTIKERFEIIIEIKFFEIFDDLKHYLKLIKYIKNYIYFISR